MSNPSVYAGRIVKVRATVQFGMESSTIVDPAQPNCPGPWYDDAPKKDETLRPNSFDEELQRRNPVYLVEDANLKRFNEALEAVVYSRNREVVYMGGLSRYEVTATMTGRIDYAKRGLGFGHLNGWRVRFLLSSVEEIATREISHDWNEFSREPGRFPHGTIRGKLTDANGHPVKSAWVGAIPVLGKIPISHPEVLTKEDGAYALDVEPGNYFVVVNRTNPATEGTPVLTTYYPPAEEESGATPLSVADFSDLIGIDIQIHRTLRPHRFEVQVLWPDGKPVKGAHVFLTQTNQAPIAAGGISYVDADGWASLVAFEGMDYILWAQLGSWPSERCAPVVNLDRNRSDAEPIVTRITLDHEACSKQADEARSAAYTMQSR